MRYKVTCSACGYTDGRRFWNLRESADAARAVSGCPGCGAGATFYPESIAADDVCDPGASYCTGCSGHEHLCHMRRK